METDIIREAAREVVTFFGEENAMRSLIILLISIIAAYFISTLVAKSIVKVAQLVSLRADTTTNDQKQIQLRRIETYLSIAIALVRVIIVAIIAYLTWNFLSPLGNPNIAAIGASAVFIVLAGGTINPLLRDITSGATMITEGWFTVGDYIRIEPFMEVGGVVERFTLRSTKLRSLNGEVIYVHNQHIQGVKVTPRGLRTIAVDLFVNEEVAGKALVEKILETIPRGTMTVATPLKITEVEQWGDKLWRIVVLGQTPPGREWLIENYFVDSIVEMNDRKKRPTLIRKPLVRYADAAAERSFKRAVRVKKP